MLKISRKTMFRDLLNGIIRRICIFLGASIRYVYHLLRQDGYSVHSLITDAPVLNYNPGHYREAFDKWKSDLSGTTLFQQLNSELKAELEALEKDGMTQAEALEMMKGAGELHLPDVDIFPRDPEWFSNRALDGLIGLILMVVLSTAAIFFFKYMG